MARLKVVIAITVMGVTLGGAGPLFLEEGRADGATPIILADYEKLPVHLRANQAKQKAKESTKVMAKRNQTEKSRSIQLAKARKELKEQLQESSHERVKHQDQLQQETLRSETLLAQADETVLKKNNPTDVVQPNGETRYLDPLDPALLMNDRSYDPNTNEVNPSSNKENNTTPRKKGPSNAWRIVLAAAETTAVPVQGTPLIPAVQYQDGLLIESEASQENHENSSRSPAEELKQLEEMFRNQQNLIRMANDTFDSQDTPTVSLAVIELAAHSQAGNDTDLVLAQKPSETHGIQSLAESQTRLSKRSYEEESADREDILRLGSRPSRVREL